MAIITHRDTIPGYITKDGSTIHELMHPLHQGNRLQSLAEACVAPGCVTQLHRHKLTEELYHITSGSGVMTLGEERITIHVGDTICIPPGTAHAVENCSAVDLVFLCCCSPPYSHQDTELL